MTDVFYIVQLKYIVFQKQVYNNEKQSCQLAVILTDFKSTFNLSV